MPLFRSHKTKLLHGLTSTMRLLLPADPGQDRMLDAVRQFNPKAKRSGHRIFVEGDSTMGVYIGPAVSIDADLRSKAQLPPDVAVAFFVNWLRGHAALAGQVFTDTYQQQVKDAAQLYREQGTYLLGGLAARFGGVSFPLAKEVGEPLHADVFTRHWFDAEKFARLVNGRLPGFGPVESKWPEHGVVALGGGGAPFEVEYWPPGVASMFRMDLSVRGAKAWQAAGSVGGDNGPMIVVRAAQPAAGIDPGIARAVGEAALGLAADTEGVCVDVFGFVVHSPEDLIVR
jgi:hypothetical protein